MFKRTLFATALTLAFMFCQALAYAQPPSLIEMVQEKLIQRGYSPGRVDGVMTDRTSSELRRFQIDNGLPATGDLNPPTIRALDLPAARGEGPPMGPPDGPPGGPSGGPSRGY